MENKIIINFGNIVSELETRNLKLCLRKNKVGMFIIDNKNNMYNIELYRSGSYLDQLIKDGIIVEFNYIDSSLSKNIGEWEKEIWDVSEVKDFIKRQKIQIKDIITDVEQIKSESQEVINSINMDTLETQKESLEVVSQQLDKVYQAIENNIDNEEIRLQLRDIENDLKWYYSSLDEMIENQEIKSNDKIKVTHNEYEKICKELASRIYTKDETKITMKQYDQMLDNYEILPFEINTDNEELKKIINIYADNESIEADRVVYRGSIDKGILYNLLNDSEGYKDLYIEYYQMIICNNKLKAILTYCEGDFIAEVYSSESGYNDGIERTKKFIDEM